MIKTIIEFQDKKIEISSIRYQIDFGTHVSFYNETCVFHPNETFETVGVYSDHFTVAQAILSKVNSGEYKETEK